MDDGSGTPASPSAPDPPPAGTALSLDTPHIEGVFDTSAAGALAVDGYVNLGSFLDPDSVDAARRLFDDAIAATGRPVGDDWFPTILLPEDDVRARITEGLESVVLGPLAAIVDPATTEVMRLDYSVKPASPTSALGPHQDYSVVDESLATSLYLWIPLSDSSIDNGTLHVVAGSHRFSNRIRSRHVPSVFDEVLDEVHEASQPLECKAGDLVLMVSGVIHHSPPNRSGELRLAVHGIIKPSGADLVFYYADERTPAGQVECYHVDIDTYVSCIHQGRPTAPVEADRVMKTPPSSMSPDRFRAGRAAYLDERAF